MSEHVYHRFTQDDLFETRVHAQPLVVVTSGSSGWSGNLGASGSVSLYGGVRARSDIGSGSAGLQVYPLDYVDTHSIDKVISVPGTYPATGSIRVVTCNSEEAQLLSDITDTAWYEEHYHPITLLADWYHAHVRATYTKGADLPNPLQLIHIPSMYYGRGIAPESVKLTDASNAKVYVDDGRGTLVLSGSDIVDRVGNVYYTEGLILFDEGVDFGNGGSTPPGTPHITIEFRGSTIINSKVFMCRLAPGEANSSNNPTFYTMDPDGNRVPKSGENTTWVTAIGIYNEERQLVAVAKLAQPIRKRERDDVTVRLKMDL